MKSFEFEARVEWTENDGTGTSSPRYGRHNEVSASGKPTIVGSAPPEFGGDGENWTLDARDRTFVDLDERGIVDPTKVVRCARERRRARGCVAARRGNGRRDRGQNNRAQPPYQEE